MTSKTFRRPSKRMFMAFVSLFALLTVAAIFLATALAPQQGEGQINPDANVELPNYYMNGMVLQRNKPINITGVTDANTRLTITLGDSEKKSTVTTTADSSGKFCATLEAPAARLESYQLTITSGNAELFSVDEVYVGDVFLAAGQSNMEANYYDFYSTETLIRGNVQNVFDTDELPELINDTNIHFIVTNNTYSHRSVQGIPLRQYCEERWLSASRDNAKYLGYLPQLFAKELRTLHSNIPIGIIQTAWGGTGIAEHTQGGHIFETHIKPLTHYNLGGILWYQGEKDAMSAASTDTYTGNFLALIREYRELFDDAELPFLYVQLARYDDNPYTAEIRQAQLQAMTALGTEANVAMTVSIDTDKGTSELIHPLGKDILAHRMVEQWENIQDNEPVRLSPLPDRAIADDSGTITITFVEDTATGLHAARPIYNTTATSNNNTRTTSAELTGFEVSDSTGEYTSAKATIQGDSIVITSSLKNISSVRYNWDDIPDNAVSLYNSYNLPTSPFILPVSYEQ